MHELAALFNDASTFPQNLSNTDFPGHKHFIFEQLNTQADRLFSSEAEAALDFLELDDAGKGSLRRHEHEPERAF